MTDARPVYQAVTWPEERWWLIRVTGVSDGGDPAAVGHLTQADSLTDTEPMVVDLITTALGGFTGFDVNVRHLLPGESRP
jgi:hypothetical protein